MDGLHLGFATGLKVSNTMPAYVGCMDYKQPALPTPAATARSIKASSFLNIFLFLQKPSLTHLSTTEVKHSFPFITSKQTARSKFFMSASFERSSDAFGASKRIFKSLC